jgi:LacI family transcriptional regulator
MGDSITIYDIAKAAGVSPSTVSRALSKPGRLSAKTESRIRQIAEHLGYLSAGPGAPSSAHSPTGIITAIIPDHLNPVYSRTVQSIEHHLGQSRYSLITLSSGVGNVAERTTMAHLLNLCDGLIFASPSMSEPDLHRLAQVRPTVMLNRMVTGVSSVTVDVSAAINEAMVMLQRSGHHSITYLAGSYNSWANESRRRIIRAAAYRYDLNYRVLRGFEPTVADGTKAADQYLAHPTDAVFAFNDQLAEGFINAVGHAGMRVPEDVSVIGFDNNRESALLSPPLTTIDLHEDALGAKAVTALLTQIRSAQPQPMNVVESASLISRQSVSTSKRTTMKLGPYVDLGRADKDTLVLTMLSNSFNETIPRIEAFTKRHPDIVIDPIEGHTQEATAALYWERLQSNRSVPDLLNIERDKMPQFAASGALLDIGSANVERSWSGEFNRAAWQSAHYAGGLYGLPGDQSQTVMFYRKDLLDHYGLAVPKTWDQFYEEGVRLHQRNPNRYMGIIDTTDVQHYLSFLRMAGCKPWHVNGVDSMGFTLHDPMIRTIAEFIQQCLDDGVLKAEPLWDSRYALPQDGVYATIVYANWFGKILAS